jgi:hypothetical protein
MPQHATQRRGSHDAYRDGEAATGRANHSMDSCLVKVAESGHVGDGERNLTLKRAKMGLSRESRRGKLDRDSYELASQEILDTNPPCKAMPIKPTLIAIQMFSMHLPVFDDQNCVCP